MDLNLIWRIRMEIWNFSPTFLSHFIIYKVKPHPLLHPAIFSWRLTNLMPWKAASYEKKCLCLRKRKVFCLELKLLYLLSDPKHTFLMTSVLLGNTYKKIEVTFTLCLHYKKHSLALEHLVQSTCISFGLDFINKGLTLPKCTAAHDIQCLALVPLAPFDV